MIKEDTINEIYKKYKRPVRNPEELRIPYFIDILSVANPIRHKDDEIEIVKLDEFNPFKRFLIRSLTGILEFDRMVAFVFPNHIIFLEKNSDEMHIHLKPELKPNLLKKIFGK